MSDTAAPWGREIAVEQVGGVPYRMYEPRTRRLASLLDHAGRWAGRAHVVQGDFRLDFADLVSAVRRKAAQLQEHGIGPGARVALLGGNGPDWGVNGWASLWLGAVPGLGNPWGSTRENEAALILFTSGSTGFPKAVVLSHRSIISGLHSLLAITKRLPQDLDGAPPSVALHTAPLFHVGGVQTLVRGVVVGETLMFPQG